MSQYPSQWSVIKRKENFVSTDFWSEKFSAFQGKIENFKNRHVLAMHIISGGSANVEEGNVKQWLSVL